MTKPDLKIAGGTGGLHVEHLRKSYRKKIVIRDFSMHLERGEVVALLGPNGSGKTTTFYAIAGLVTPEGGTVTVDGKDVTSLPMYRRAQLGIGYLPQEMSIFRGLSVQDNISAILDISVPHRRERRERLEELLSEFSIEHLRRAPALALSGGESKISAAGRTLCRRRPDFGRRHPPPCGGFEEPGHRGSDYGPQRARNPRNRGSGLYSARRPRVDVGHPGRGRSERKCPPCLPGRQFPYFLRFRLRSRRFSQFSNAVFIDFPVVSAPNEGMATLRSCFPFPRPSCHGMNCFNALPTPRI